jgi:ribonuclease HI
MQQVYCDGSCLNNGKQNARAGYGVYFGENDLRNKAGKLPGTTQTNNRGELMAILEALKISSSGDIEIITDSNLAVKTFTEWLNTWKKSKWWKSKDWTHKDAKKNCDLISEIDNLIQSRQGIVKFTHVYGHRDNYGNIQADKLANEGAVKEPIKETVKEPIKEPVKELIKEPVKELIKEPVKELIKEVEKLRLVLEKYKVPESKIKKIISEWQEPNV